ncbi:DsbA family protein [Streptomyces sp. Tu102]|uniref:DsbA family protein n=1 Tax=Streptomyces sp. Tu102 TaxID=2838019 RepID=UPI001BDC5A0D|nr:DsbA family protein [Streptomyces sp. Tu102]MBT1095461.1 DsbA family protein [Streptomyces sp. Tu102]
MHIEVWADMVCPWAYIGKRRLEKALAGRTAEVVWRPVRIDPTAPAQATPVAGPSTAPPGQCAVDPVASAGALPQDVLQVAEREGFPQDWGPAWRVSSHDAHRLALLAYEHGGSALQNRVVEQIMNAYFLDGADIGDRRILHHIAARTGLGDRAALLDTDAADRGVRELLLIGKARSLTTSPTFVIGNRSLVGAQSVEAIVEFLTAAKDFSTRQLPEEVNRLRWSESLLEQRGPLGALTLLQPLLDQHADDVNVRRLAARAYFHSAQLSRAHDVLRSLAADAPDDAYVRLLLGRTLQRLGQDDEAAVHLKVAAAMNPDYA